MAAIGEVGTLRGLLVSGTNGKNMIVAVAPTLAGA
jgi:hypothetical protein